MDAYDRYLEARALLPSRTEFQRMITLLTEATEQDPEFAEAWATLSQVWALTFYYNIEEQDTALRKAEILARKALELDPDLADAHTALANVLRDQARWNEARDSYLRALELNPNDVEAHVQFGQMLVRVGDFEAALKHGKQAADIDPLSWLNQSFYAIALYLTGERSQAYEALEKAEVLSGGTRSLILRFKLRILLSDGNVEGAREAVARFKRVAQGRDLEEMSVPIALVESIDEPAKALALLRSIDVSSRDEMHINNIASDLFWVAYFKDYDLADEWMAFALQRTDNLAEIDSTWLAFPAVYPIFDRPSFARLLQRNRLDTYWRAHGWPAYCWPVNALDFECGEPKESGKVMR